MPSKAGITDCRVPKCDRKTVPRCGTCNRICSTAVCGLSVTWDHQCVLLSRPKTLPWHNSADWDDMVRQIVRCMAVPVYQQSVTLTLIRTRRGSNRTTQVEYKPFPSDTLSTEQLAFMIYPTYLWDTNCQNRNRNHIVRTAEYSADWSQNQNAPVRCGHILTGIYRVLCLMLA